MHRHLSRFWFAGNLVCFSAKSKASHVGSQQDLDLLRIHRSIDFALCGVARSWKSSRAGSMMRSFISLATWIAEIRNVSRSHQAA